MATTGSMLLARAAATERAAPSPGLMPFERAHAQSWPEPWRDSWQGLAPDRAPAPRRADPPSPPAANPEACLVNLVAAHVVPHLVAANRGVPPRHITCAEAASFTAGDVAEFATLLIGADGVASASYINRAVHGGAEAAAIYVELLAPAARHLGNLWDQDVASAADVTIGLGRLHYILRALAPSFHRDARPPHAGRRVLLMAPKGEQQRFALAMAEAFFSRAGWLVEKAAQGDPATWRGAARRGWFDIAGFAVTGCEQPEVLAGFIRAARAISQNQRIGIITISPTCIEQPHWADGLGADASFTDAAQAVRRAEILLAKLVPCVSGGRETDSWRDA